MRHLAVPGQEQKKRSDRTHTWEITAKAAIKLEDDCEREACGSLICQIAYPDSQNMGEMNGDKHLYAACGH
jgi:hypothetical protein